MSNTKRIPRITIEIKYLILNRLKETFYHRLYPRLMYTLCKMARQQADKEMLFGMMRHNTTCQSFLQLVYQQVSHSSRIIPIILLHLNYLNFASWKINYNFCHKIVTNVIKIGIVMRVFNDILHCGILKENWEWDRIWKLKWWRDFIQV